MNTTELLLDRLLHHATQAQRRTLMAECPLAYYRYYVDLHKSDESGKARLRAAICSAVSDSLVASDD